MSEPTDYAIDKSGWPDGPWKTEPDRIEWTHAGYTCLIRRHPHHGALCGYVGVDNTHPLYGEEWNITPAVDELAAHRGVNYSGHCSGEICHVPAPGMPDDVWWFGFDCAHAFDLSPGFLNLEAEAEERSPVLRNMRERLEQLPSAELFREVYRDLAYVKAVTEGLAAQLRALAL
jgi:hypothetical protein